MQPKEDATAERRERAIDLHPAQRDGDLHQADADSERPQRARW